MDLEIFNFSLGEKLGEGNSKIAFSIPNDSTKLILIYKNSKNNLTELTKEFEIIKQIHDSIPLHINFPKYLNCGIFSENFAVIMQRVQGEVLFTRKSQENIELYRISLQKTNNIDEKHFIKLKQDKDELFNLGIICDYSKPDNLIFNVEKGFSIIDPLYNELLKYSITSEGIPPLIKMILPNISYSLIEELNIEDARIVMEIYNKIMNVEKSSWENDLIEISKNLTNN